MAKKIISVITLTIMILSNLLHCIASEESGNLSTYEDLFVKDEISDGKEIKIFQQT